MQQSGGPGRGARSEQKGTTRKPPRALVQASRGRKVTRESDEPIQASESGSQQRRERRAETGEPPGRADTTENQNRRTNSAIEADHVSGRAKPPAVQADPRKRER